VSADDVATTVPVRLDFESRAPEVYKALVRVDSAAREQLEQVGFDARLSELVRVRASQLNGCAYCIDMHTKDARAAGESEQRLYALTAWRDTPFFTERERAALAFTEAVTLMNVDHVPDGAYEAVAEHYDEDEIAALVSLLVAINAWNAIGVSLHAWVPGSYEP
jgi:AhpD family alkylhydroperoxidase